MSATVLTPSASAVEIPQDCPSGYVCLYEHRDFQGQIAKAKASSFGRSDYWVPKDRVSSWANHSVFPFVALEERGMRPFSFHWPIFTIWPWSLDAWVGRGNNDRMELIGRGVKPF